MSKEKGAASGSISVNSLIAGSVVNGNIESVLDIRIDGTVNGDLNCKAKVVIGESGKVTGNIFCQNALVMGAIKGNIDCQLSLDIRAEANIEGDLSCAKLIIEDGASFNGKCKMELGHGVGTTK